MLHADKAKDRTQTPPFKTQNCVSLAEDPPVSMKLWSTLGTEELIILENTCIFKIFLPPEKSNSTWSPHSGLLKQLCRVSTVADSACILTHDPLCFFSVFFGFCVVRALKEGTLHSPELYKNICSSL